MQQRREGFKPEKKVEDVEYTEEEIKHFDSVRDIALEAVLDILLEKWLGKDAISHHHSFSLENILMSKIDENLRKDIKYREWVMEKIYGLVEEYLETNRANGTLDQLVIEHYKNKNNSILLDLYTETRGILEDNSAKDKPSLVAEALFSKQVPYEIAEYILPILLNNDEPERKPLALEYKPEISIVGGEKPDTGKEVAEVVDDGKEKTNVDPESVLRRWAELEKESRGILGRKPRISERENYSQHSLEIADNSLFLSSDNRNKVNDPKFNFLIIDDLVKKFLKISSLVSVSDKDRKQVLEEMETVFADFINHNRQLLLCIVESHTEEKIHLKDMRLDFVYKVAEEMKNVLESLLGQDLRFANVHLQDFLRQNHPNKDKFLAIFFLIVRILLDKNSNYYTEVQKNYLPKEYGEAFLPQSAYTVLGLVAKLFPEGKGKSSRPFFHEKYTEFMDNKLKNLDLSLFGIVPEDFSNIESSDKNLKIASVKSLIKTYLSSGVTKLPILFNTGFDANYQLFVRGLRVDTPSKVEELLIENFARKIRLPGDNLFSRMVSKPLALEQKVHFILREFIRENVVYDNRIFI